MNYEQKYKEALGWMRKLYPSFENWVKEDAEHYFPELAESEDERIRKEIIQYIKTGTYHKDWVTWLENQGEQKPYGQRKECSDCQFNYTGECKGSCQMKIDGQKPAKNIVEAWKDMRLEVYQQASGNRHEPNYSDDTTKMFSLNDIDEIIEKISEQKTEDKVEQKFKVGDWISGYYTNYKVLSVNNDSYLVEDTDGNKINILFENEKYHHLFTIADAKHGDVLAINWHKGDDSWEIIIIFVKYHNNGVKGWINTPCVEGYGNTFKNGKLAFNDEEVPYYSKMWTANLHPATKEQCELLFQTMKEAGYEWDAENKKLKKVGYKK